MKFTFTIEVPDGSIIHVEPVASIAELKAAAQDALYTPPSADQLIPLPDAIPLPGDPAPFRGAAQNPPPGCPVHRVPWKVVPAGVSKKSGKPYQAFQVCSVQGCDQRPAA